MKKFDFIVALFLFLCGMNLFGGELLSKGKSTKNSILDKDDYYEIEINYPSFDNYPAISEDIKNYAMDNFKSEKTMINDYHEMDLEIYPDFIKEYSFSLRYELYESDKYISVLFTLSEFGIGAVGNQGYETKVYSKATEKPVNLYELTGKSDYQLKRECRAQTLQQIKKTNPSITSTYEINEILNDIMGDSVEDTPDYILYRYVVEGSKVLVFIDWYYYGGLQYYSEFNIY